jgi:hypothetical protein
MVRRDYELITNTLAQAVNDCTGVSTKALIYTIGRFCENLKDNNPNFSELQLVDSIQAMNVNPDAIDGLQSLHNFYLDKQPTVKQF